MIDKIENEVANFLSLHPAKTITNLTVACFGLAFKPNIDDLRESPALNIVKELAELNFGRLLAVEPNVEELPSSLKNCAELRSINEALSEADICVLLVDHDEFKSIEKERLENIIIVDTKGIWK